MPKGLDALVEINKQDAKNGTQNLMLGIDVVEVTKRKAGTVVSIGIAGDLVAAIGTGAKMAMLIVVDAAEFKKVQEQP